MVLLSFQQWVNILSLVHPQTLPLFVILSSNPQAIVEFLRSFIFKHVPRLFFIHLIFSRVFVITIKSPTYTAMIVNSVTSLLTKMQGSEVHCLKLVDCMCSLKTVFQHLSDCFLICKLIFFSLRTKHSFPSLTYPGGCSM